MSDLLFKGVTEGLVMEGNDIALFCAEIYETGVDTVNAGPGHQANIKFGHR